MINFPIMGLIIPWIGVRNIPLNTDLSVVDTGEFDILDEVGPYYVRIVAFEWLGFGCTVRQLDGGRVRRTGTDVFLDEEI